MQFTLRNWKNMTAAAAAALVMAALLIVGGSYAAYAQTDDTTATTTVEATTPHEAVETAIADALGLTVDELADQLWAGRSLADLAEQAGVEVADLRTAAEEAQQSYQVARIQAAVEAGDITQEQADWMIQGIEQGYWTGGRGFGRGMGMHHYEMHGGGMYGGGMYGGGMYGSGMFGGHHGWDDSGSGMGMFGRGMMGRPFAAPDTESE